MGTFSNGCLPARKHLRALRPPLDGCPAHIAANSLGREIWRQTPLHMALEAGQEAVVTCLLEFSQPSPGLYTKLLDLNIKNSAEETPLAVALGKGFTHLATQMIQSGSDVNVTDGSGMSLLLKAIRDSDLTAASFLLSHGADINTRSPQGMTPLELAVRYDDDDDDYDYDDDDGYDDDCQGGRGEHCGEAVWGGGGHDLEQLRGAAAVAGAGGREHRPRQHPREARGGHRPLGARPRGLQPDSPPQVAASTSKLNPRTVLVCHKLS